MSVSEILAESWSWSWPLALFALGALALYAAGARRSLRAPGGAGLAVRALAAVALFLAAFLSPIGGLANGLSFTAHMVQHLLLLLIVPLLCLLALPRLEAERWFARPRVDRVGRLCARPQLGWALALGAMWAWHAPPCCDAAVLDPRVAALKYATLLAAGAVFWWPLFSPVRRYRMRCETAVGYLFSACLGCSLLGIFLTFTTQTVCPALASPIDQGGTLRALRALGLSSGTDQQLGGLVMWIPACTIYLGGIAAILVRWYGEQPERPFGPEPEGARVERA